MNSSAGISTPVESISTVTTIFRIWAIAELANALERAIDIRIAGNFLNEVVALVENVTAYAHELICVRRMRQIITAKIRIFGKRPVSFSCS